MSKEDKKIKVARHFKPNERRIDFVDYRGAICNQNGCPMVHGIIGKLYAKNEVPDLLFEQFSLPTDMHCGLKRSYMLSKGIS